MLNFASSTDASTPRYDSNTKIFQGIPLQIDDSPALAARFPGNEGVLELSIVDTMVTCYFSRNSDSSTVAALAYIEQMGTISWLFFDTGRHKFCQLTVTISVYRGVLIEVPAIQQTKIKTFSSFRVLKMLAMQIITSLFILELLDNLMRSP